MVKLNKDLGCYLPAFFNMEISFPFSDSFSPMLNMPIKEQNIAVFVHEYIHFLQDISTYTGLNNAYFYSEYIHAAVNTIYTEAARNNDKFKVPLSIVENNEHIELVRQINSIGMGCLDQFNYVFPLRITENKIKASYSNTNFKYLTKVSIVAQNNLKIHFGSRAIMESMAYLIEKEITRGAGTAPNFPYDSAEMVVNLIYPQFGEDNLNIIALCDMSLLFSEPGKVFYDTLLDFSNRQYLPTRPEDIVDYFYNNPSVQIEDCSQLAMGFTKMAFEVGNRLKDYMKGKEFLSFHNVIHRLLGFAIDKRINHRYFFIDLVRDGYALHNKTLQNIICAIGSPMIKDSKNDYWDVPPVGVQQEDYSIEYFTAILEMNKLFENGNDCCEMYDWCQKSPNAEVDDRCIFEPWARCHDQKLCPYAVLWKHWGLGNYKPKF